MFNVSGNGSYMYGLYIGLDDVAGIMHALHTSEAETKVEVVVELEGVRKEFTYAEFCDLLGIQPKTPTNYKAE